MSRHEEEQKYTEFDKGSRHYCHNTHPPSCSGFVAGTSAPMDSSLNLAYKLLHKL